MSSIIPSVPQFRLPAAPPAPQLEKFERSKLPWYRELAYFIGQRDSLITASFVAPALLAGGATGILFGVDYGLAVGFGLGTVASTFGLVPGLALTHLADNTHRLIEDQEEVFSHLVRKRQQAIAQEDHRSLNDWVQANYGLQLNPKNLALDWREKDEAPIELLSAQGATLKARLVRTDAGSFELRKSEIHSPTESVYFDTVGSSNQLTAIRSPAAALTAGRE